MLPAFSCLGQPRGPRAHGATDRQSLAQTTSWRCFEAARMPPLRRGGLLRESFGSNRRASFRAPHARTSPPA